MALIGLGASWPNVSRAGMAAVLTACCSSLAPLAPAQAEDALEVTITVKNHAFDPAQIEVPAGKPVVLRIKNLDASPMEFESKSLRVEKVLSGNGEAVINLRPQKPGRYEFFDDFHAATTKGVVVVK
jgi:plastocyanin